VSDRVLILEHAIYSVISPEQCAVIMWRDVSRKDLAAEALRLTAPEVAKIGCVDEIIREPQEGAHIDPPSAAVTLTESLRRHLDELRAMPLDAMIAARQAKFRNIAQFYTEG
jgi:acetyl-CoA carboxylase carboxyl transferase subunit alpha